MAAQKKFGVEFDSEFGDWHVVDHDLPDETPDGDRNSLCDTKDRDRAFRIVKHLENRHEPPYKSFKRADSKISIITGDNSLLVVIDDGAKAERLLGYLEG
jgi:hypothetical protein